VLKDVQKIDYGRIFGMAPPLIGELSQVHRQWAVGSKQSKRMLLEPPTLRGLFVSGDIRSCECKVRRVAETHGIVACLARITETRTLRKRLLEET
jgi:hypothetical protein